MNQQAMVVGYKVSIPSTEYPVTYYESKLSESISSGGFTSTMRKVALLHNLTELIHGSSSSIIIGENPMVDAVSAVSVTQFVK